MQAYHCFWWHRGDVYRLLLSLGAAIDGIAWPEADRPEVQLLQHFVHSVTGACTHESPSY